MEWISVGCTTHIKVCYSFKRIQVTLYQGVMGWLTFSISQTIIPRKAPQHPLQCRIDQYKKSLRRFHQSMAKMGNHQQRQMEAQYRSHIIPYTGITCTIARVQKNQLSYHSHRRKALETSNPKVYHHWVGKHHGLPTSALNSPHPQRPSQAVQVRHPSLQRLQIVRGKNSPILSMQQSQRLKNL